MSWINGFARDALCPTPTTSPAQSLLLVGACAAAAGLLLGALAVLFLLNCNKKSDGGDGDARVPRYHSRADEFFGRTAEDGAAPPLPSPSPARTPTSALLAGIRVSLAECGGEHGDDTSPDVSRPPSEAFQITQRTTAGRGKAGFEFVEYAPSIFWRIRRLYGVSEAELQESLGSVSGSFALGEGKGGCMFLPTSDRRFLMKTVKEDEKEKLLHILEDYYGALVCQLRVCTVRRTRISVWVMCGSLGDRPARVCAPSLPTPKSLPASPAPSFILSVPPPPFVSRSHLPSPVDAAAMVSRLLHSQDCRGHAQCRSHAALRAGKR